MSVDSQISRGSLPIGVFDSGVGGLTVLRALQAVLPDERFLYLGDTARLPYGTKTPETIRRYALQAAAFLQGRGIKCLVIACNTASAHALEALQARYPGMPIVGVIEPGAEAGCAISRSGHIAVIATEGTVQGGAYQRAIARIRADARVIARACSLFVPLAEEGWLSGDIVDAVAHRYLDEVFAGVAAPDTLLLGCTHFPVLRTALQSVVGDQVSIVDSAQTTAQALKALLTQRGLLAGALSVARRTQAVTFMATDGPARFARVAAYFLQQPIHSEQIELIDSGFAVN